MNTPSHFLLTAAIGTSAKGRTKPSALKLPSLRMSGFLLGSVLPDLPLIVMAIVSIARDRISGAFAGIDFNQMQPGQPVPQEWLDASWTLHLFEVWFFENPWVITLHNLFHSPLLLVIYIATAYLLWKRGTRGAGWFFWLSCAAMLHTFADIPLHVNDGPLLLFPLNWRWRFISPVSYWDPNHYGREWSYFENTLNLFFVVYLLWHYRQPMRDWFQRRFSKESTFQDGNL